MKKFSIVFMSILVLGGMIATVSANGKTDITLITLPFGTPSYVMDSALESFFKKQKNSSVNIQLKQTPGAMYVIRTLFEQDVKTATGQVPQPMVINWAPVFYYATEGRPPLTKFPLPNLRVLYGGFFFVNTFVTFDKSIKTPADLAGKKVGFAERARPFQSVFPNKPYFDRGYGGFGKVKWQYLGSANSKDALMNGSIDAHWGTLIARGVLNEDGSVSAVMVAPSPPMLELLSSGRPLYFVQEDPAITRSAYNQKTDQVMLPVFVKKGALKGLNKDLWTRGMASVMTVHKSMPNDIAEEIVTTVFTNLKRLSAYSKMFALYPPNPYPIGIGKDMIHPGLFKALKKLGVKPPAGAR
jgi:TRAP-type uncharacterized transport system substrate-binding protein